MNGISFILVFDPPNIRLPMIPEHSGFSWTTLTGWDVVLMLSWVVEATWNKVVDSQGLIVVVVVVCGAGANWVSVSPSNFIGKGLFVQQNIGLPLLKPHWLRLTYSRSRWLIGDLNLNLDTLWHCSSSTHVPGYWSGELHFSKNRWNQHKVNIFWLIQLTRRSSAEVKINKISQ